MWQIMAPFSLVVTELGPAQLSLFHLIHQLCEGLKQVMQWHYEEDAPSPELEDM